MRGWPSVVAMLAVVGALLWLAWPDTDAPRYDPPWLGPGREPAAPEALPEPPPDEERRAARLTVVVETPAGKPRPYVPISIAHRGERFELKRTDQEGVADFGLREESVLEVWAHPEPGIDLRVGTFARRDGDHVMPFTLYEPRWLVVQVTFEGRAHLPDDARVTEPPLAAVVRTPERGEILGRFYPRRRDNRVHVEAPGFLNGGASAWARIESNPVIVPIELHRGVRLQVTVQGPEGVEKDLRLERHDRGVWKELGFAEYEVDERGRNRVVFDEPPGRFRARLRSSRILLWERELRDDFELDLDLTRAQWLSVLIELPEGTPVTGTHVLLDDRWIGPPRLSYGRRHLFRLLLPGNRAYRVRPVHPICAPVAGHEELRTATGGEHILRMEPLPLVTFRVDLEFRPSRLDVELFAPDDLTKSVRSPDAVFLHGEYAFAAPEAGRYAVRVHLRKHAPLFLREVELPAGGCDLGPLEPSRGSNVRVVLSFPSMDDFLPDMINDTWITLERVELPPVRKSSIGCDLDSAEVEGLPAGTYLVKYGVGRLSKEERIELDGECDHDLVVDVPPSR